MSEWVSVKDRMPEPGVPVLVVYSGHVQYVTYQLEAIEWSSTEGGETMPLSFVSHWMPLPEPPNEQ